MKFLLLFVLFLLHSIQIIDKRFAQTWIGGPQVDADGNAIMVDGSQLNYTYNLRSIDNPGCYPMEGYRMVKYEIISGDWGSSYDDIPFFRYADVLLMKAECLLRLGTANDTEAENLVARVRERAITDPSRVKRSAAELRGGSVYNYGHWENTAKQDESDAIDQTLVGGDDIDLGGLLDELAWEFVAEHHRRQDLIRFKMDNGQNVYNGKAWFCKEAVTGNNRDADIFPIPKSVMNGNINLKQNTGFN